MTGHPAKELRFLLALTLVFAASPSPAEVVSELGSPGTLVTNDPEINARNMGWGYVDTQQFGPCLSEEVRQEHWRLTRENAAALDLPINRSQMVLFGWPLAAAPSLTDFGYHGISNFVDQNPAFPNQLLDYECGARTYDQSSGYNHAGIDFFTWPFSWKKMDESSVHVVASAAGTIVNKFDGNYDRQCGFGNCNWNAVYVQHSDGSITWYGHMKNGSTTTKTIGQSVAAGEYLGVVGSSGCSTGPHLHMETYDSGGSLIEPYSGPCNSMNPQSWWQSQRPYYDSAVNALMTHSAPPVFPACPQQETTNEQIQFPLGTTVYFGAYYRDQLSGQISQYEVLRPNGTTFTSWTASLGVPHYAASWWWWSRNIPPFAPQGVWTFRVTYESVVYEHRFAMGTVVGAEELAVVPVETRLRGNHPNPFGVSTDILFDLARTGAVQLDLYDVTGRRVGTLLDATLSAGRHHVPWDGRDVSGVRVAAGVYLYRLRTADIVESDRLVYRP